MIETPRNLAIDLLETLGVPTARCTRAVIVIEPNDLIRVVATYFTGRIVDERLDLVKRRYQIRAEQTSDRRAPDLDIIVIEAMRVADDLAEAAHREFEVMANDALRKLTRYPPCA